MTIKKVLQKNKLLLKKHNIENFQLDAEILLCFVLGENREFLLIHEDYKVSVLLSIRFSICIKKRIKGFSVASIIGKKSFYGYDFFVNKNCLIPRPETELMSQEVKCIISSNKNNFTIVDIGTGSGCIIVSILKELIKLNIDNNHFLYYAIDISKKALKTAKKNITWHNLEKRISLLHGNLLSPIIEKINISDSPKNPLLITANLPYLTKNQIINSPSIQKEPNLALDGGKEGVFYYKQLFKQIKKIEKDYTSPIFILCEIDPDQPCKITNLQKEILPLFKTTIKKDLVGKSRLAIIEKISN